eukprot:c11531_g1_i1.p1 GENE.c11531_g1_i1~~c11531_g1_i1.p1  ORF type:complete len:1486 (+),score=281.84 c11531_g1_i1:336-4460(+)
MGALTFAQLRQLARHYSLPMSPEEAIALKPLQFGFQEFVEWYTGKNGPQLDLPLNSVRRYFNSFSTRYGAVTGICAKEIINFLGLDGDMVRVEDSAVLTFRDFAAILIPDIDTKYHRVMLNELKEAYEEADLNNDLLINAKEVWLIARYFGLTPAQAKGIKMDDGAMHFHELVQWYTARKTADVVSFNVIKRRFDQRDILKTGRIDRVAMTELSRFFGDQLIRQEKEFYTFEDCVTMVVPELPHDLRVAPLNELRLEFDRCGGTQTGEIAFSVLMEKIQYYNLPNYSTNEFKNEQITFDRFVMWYCRELDLAHFKVKYDEVNSHAATDMTKETFSKFILSMGIKLDPMERNQLFADSFVDLGEFASVMKSRGIEYMELPADPEELRKLKMGFISANVLKKRFDGMTQKGSVKISAAAMIELCDFFLAPPPQELQQEYTFQEYIDTVIQEPTHFLKKLPLNEIKASFDEHDARGVDLLSVDEAEALAAYFGVQPPPQDVSEDGVSFQEMIAQMKGINLSKLSVNIFRRRFNKTVPNRRRIDGATYEYILRFFGVKSRGSSPDYSFRDVLIELTGNDSYRSIPLDEIKDHFEELSEDGSILTANQLHEWSNYYSVPVFESGSEGDFDNLLKWHQKHCPSLENLSFNALRRRFNEAGPSNEGLLTDSGFGELCYFLSITKPDGEAKHYSFCDLVKALSPARANTLLNELRLSFNETVGAEGNPSLQSHHRSAICDYLELPAFEGALSFHDFVGHATSARQVLGLNPLKKRFDEWNVDGTHVLRSSVAEKLCLHFGVEFAQLGVTAPTFHEIVASVLGPQQTRLNDLKQCFEECIHDPKAWKASDSDLYDATWYYRIREPFPTTTDRETVPFSSFVSWFLTNATDIDSLSNLNVLRRRYCKYTNSRISESDLEDLCHFFNVPYPTSVGDELSFHETVHVLCGEELPLLQAALNELFSQFEEYEPDGERIDIEILSEASSYFDVEFRSSTSFGVEGKVSFQDFYEWYSTGKPLRRRPTAKIVSMNVLQKRFNERVDGEVLTFPWVKITRENAIEICKYFAETDEAMLESIPNTSDGHVTFQELCISLMNTSDDQTLSRLMLNELKLVFEECDHDGTNKLSIRQFQEAAHFLELPLRNFDDAKLAEGGMTFSVFLDWVISRQPDNEPPIAKTTRRWYNNKFPNFNSLRKRFNQIDEMTGLLTVEKVREFFRFFEFDVIALAEARSIYEQQIQNVPEESQEPEQFDDEHEAFNYLLPPPIIDEYGTEYPLELTFQESCEMAMFPTDIYYHVETLNELKDLFEILEESIGDEGAIPEALFLDCLKTYYLSEDERTTLETVNGLITFNEFVRKLAFAPKSFVGFAIKQTGKKGRECMSQCAVM